VCKSMQQQLTLHITYLASVNIEMQSWMTACAETGIKVGRNIEAKRIRCISMRSIGAKSGCHIAWRIGIRDLNVRKCTVNNLLHTGLPGIVHQGIGCVTTQQCSYHNKQHRQKDWRQKYGQR